MELGIDVGGTNTDVVLLKRNTTQENNREVKIVASIKTPTTKDVMSGVVNGVKELLATPEAKDHSGEIENVFLGTTQFVNAVVERSGDLRRVAVLRLSGEATASIPPFTSLPQDLREKVEGPHFYISGGCDYKGADFYPLKLEEVEAACEEIKAAGILDIAVVGMFSSTRGDQEEAVGKKISEVFPEARVTLSKNVGQQNLLLREHSAILNAAMRALAKKVVLGFVEAFSTKLTLGSARVFLTQNDGTLLPLSEALTYPIRTIGCGPTNSMRGAYLLCVSDGVDLGSEDVFVCDVGGTTSDIGVISTDGVPRLANLQTVVGGVPLNARFPDTTSLALGGGTKINAANGTVGPDSVGYRLKEKALVFGGDTLTATDIAVAAGHLNIDGADAVKVKNSVSAEDVDALLAKFIKMISITVAKLKTKPGDVKLVLCGGGAALIPPTAKIEGVSDVLRPSFANVANAVGAAMAQAGSSIDLTVDLSNTTRDEALAAQEAILRRKCVENGAQESTVKIVSLHDQELQYLAYPGRRIMGRAVGDINFSAIGSVADLDPSVAKESGEEGATTQAADAAEDKKETTVKCPLVELHPTEHAPAPTVDEKGVWTLSFADVQMIAMGCSILGAGGGGNTILAMERMKAMFQGGNHKIKIISPDSLRENDENVTVVAYFGAPTVMTEMLGRGDEMHRAAVATEKDSGKKATVYMSAEVGGCNALEPLFCAANDDIPCVDADGMGRAFPKISLYLPFFVDGTRGPVAMVGTRSEPTMFSSESLDDLENSMRQHVEATHGAVAAVCLSPITKQQVLQGACLNTMSLSWKMGQAIHNATVDKRDPVEEVAKLNKGKVLLRGTVIAPPLRDEVSAYSAGHVPIQSHDKEHITKVYFLNEYIACNLDDKTMLATSPDLICILDDDTGKGIFVDELQMGLRVAVLALPSPAGFRKEPLMSATHPKSFRPAFGDIDAVLMDHTQDTSFSVPQEYCGKK